ncbi:aspartyl-phosphate phosphatase Spo0E family protein [Paenibacillus alba]|uniref:Aspartyl-phosphate phosphatase Spo0E family protein n=1 Tax=Paenibacillus alba TaxID=1197127 RepID=A0ABU6G5N1_9BACL|nr:aspartyl-phosphate phosphatase Spo0E family protein [Paenibacillus alba]MEC0229477.1 aspartyl-phosphate phosphatase Spo0E family protein [Paenibacillus alba]NQX71764.1 aspartyl-phosphate phosphatase Spo0E family protein [Paenibacillus alba]
MTKPILLDEIESFRSQLNKLVQDHNLNELLDPNVIRLSQELDDLIVSFTVDNQPLEFSYSNK